MKELKESTDISILDFELPFIIESDTSYKAVVFVLLQKQNGRERTIRYGSKMLIIIEKIIIHTKINFLTLYVQLRLIRNIYTNLIL
ncbi:hypothetical protein A0H76_2845 [Hepatospora eriocheir]|uniref:Reverse transcriptase/retrotransposon-derived protein RNase H-like domain-containing protein n=1 Tax=Hepatospora eriocheir TaxID=1081669 RepID=A0A1X0Q5L9_9MICR|nr:hypothetical protein A0H76_2845 [Hepatospora eriocheir]